MGDGEATGIGDSQDFLRVLCRLRWFAVAGQALTIAVVTGPMAIPIEAAPLWAGVAALAAFNLYAEWRLRQERPAAAAECFLHVLADIAILAWQVAWSGGIENPFASLFLLPIALSIPALPRRWVLAVAGCALTGYVVAAIAGSPLPHAHGLADDTFSLHKLGMLVNFVVSAAVLVYFLARITSAWRASEREIARLRERFTRNEGILALATHAASVAHELNTPLGTMTLMVDDLLDGGGDAPPREELSTLRRLLQECRDRVRALAAAALDDGGRGAPGADLDEVVSRWQLLRPAVELRRSGGLPAHVRIDTAVGHLLQALLNNAADAGERAGRNEVDLHLVAEGGRLRGEIRDFGAGFGPSAVPLPGTRFGSDKPGGLGIGLALSHATVERLGGSLTMHAASGGPGVRVVFELPMAGGEA
jgi:two-component system sensor histidine kinase RegB